MHIYQLNPLLIRPIYGVLLQTYPSVTNLTSMKQVLHANQLHARRQTHNHVVLSY